MGNMGAMIAPHLNPFCGPKQKNMVVNAEIKNTKCLTPKVIYEATISHINY